MNSRAAARGRERPPRDIDRTRTQRGRHDRSATRRLRGDWAMSTCADLVRWAWSSGVFARHALHTAR